ncbi:fibronectin type III domain-containing protein, partial [Endothiovibrio diazotrophicus]
MDARWSAFRLVGLLCGLLWGAPGLAHTLSGTVFGGAQALPEAQVEVRDATSGSLVATVTTGGDGGYAVTGLVGSYRLTVVPPAGSAYQASQVDAVAVSDGDATQNVFLLAAHAVWSGTLFGADGVTPAKNIRLTLYNAATRSLAGQLTTGPDGAFRFQVDAADYRVKVDKEACAATGGVGTPGFFQLADWQVVSVAGDTQRDLSLPSFLTLRGRTVDEAGNPLAGVRISSLASGQTDLGTYGVREGDDGCPRFSATDGSYELTLLPADYRIQLIPPAGGTPAYTVHPQVAVVDGGPLDLVVHDGVRVHGVLTAADGVTPADNFQIHIEERYRRVRVASVTTAADGSYSVDLAPDSYALSIERSACAGGNLAAPTALLIDRYHNFSVSGETTLDVALPAMQTVSGHTVNGGTPVAGVGIQATARWYTEDYVTYTVTLGAEGCPVHSGSDGSYSFTTLPAAYQLTLEPPAGGALATTRLVDFALGDEPAVDLPVDGPVELSGTLLAADGTTPVAGVWVGLYADGAVPTLIDYDVTGADGRYRFSAAPGPYAFMLSKSRVSDDTVVTSGRFYYHRYQSLTLTGDTVQDIVLPPYYTVAGFTTDGNGVPVPGVGVSANGDSSADGRYLRDYYPDGTSGELITSALDGSYRLGLAGRSYQFKIYPPADSGFLDTVVPGVEITGATRNDIILQHLDQTAPRILSGPHARQIGATSAVIEWLTDEPADGAVSAGSAHAEEGAFSTVHSVTLTGLAPATDYVADVSSSDAAGNGPVTATVAFRTGEQADRTPPVIIEGPVITAIGADQATVEWRTDEPADGVVLAADGSVWARDGGYAVEHRFRLSGLSPAATYALTVGSSDALGNGPTQSAEVTFTTLAAADTVPPVIVAGPIVTGISDREAMVEWETDEPATSGVSFNDGVHYQVLSDERPLTRHSVTLTGLAAATAYQVTVSSSDAQGNGPTLGTPFTFTTLAAADVTPPMLIGEVRVVGLTHHSALIQWRTDEPADGVVAFGTAADALDGRATESRLTVQHSVQLTGLAADTLYHFRASSSDSAGNRWTSALATFRSAALPDTAAPLLLETPQVIGADATSATLFWVTDEPTDGVVSYGLGGATDRTLGDGRRQREHRVTLTGLTPGAAHSFLIQSCDLAGNPVRFESIAGERRAAGGGFTTPAQADVTPPQFVEVPAALYLALDRAVIRWRTDEIADSRVAYAPAAGGEGRTAAELVQRFDHQLVLTGLTPGTAYRLTASSSDGAGNRAQAAPITFQTPVAADLQAPALIAGPEVRVSGGVVEVRW